MAKPCEIVHLLLVLIYTFIGISSFAVFIYLKNYPAAVLGLITGVINAFLSHLHILHLRKKLTVWYSDRELGHLYYLGLLVYCIGATCFVFFLVEEIWIRTGFFPISKSLLIPIIFSCITQKTAIMLWYYMNEFRKIAQDSETVPCIVPDEVVEDLGVVEICCDEVVEADRQPPNDSQNDV